MPEDEVKRELQAINAKLERLLVTLHGDGQNNGVMTRLALLEANAILTAQRESEAEKKSDRLVWGMLGALGTALLSLAVIVLNWLFGAHK